MILLDTNVVSELVKSESDPRVSTWMHEQAEETLFLSSVTVAELVVGIAYMPDGKRKRVLQASVDEQLQAFNGRILPFGIDAAHRYAELAILARKAGEGFPVPDGYIAAIASSHGFAVASRDTSPYLAGGIKVINPWVA